MIAVSTLPPESSLVALEPVVRRLLDRHLDAAKEWFPHEYVPWELGRSFTQQPWGAAYPRGGAPAGTPLELTLLPENTSPYSPRAWGKALGGGGAGGGGPRRWTAEEGRHSIAIRDYLLTTRAVDP